MLQWMVIYPRVCGQHKLDSMGVKNNNNISILRWIPIKLFQRAGQVILKLLNMKNLDQDMTTVKAYSFQILGNSI